ncbi:MAG: aminoacyl-tRNA hydrolase [Dehalococcoidia bacterium]
MRQPATLIVGLGNPGRSYQRSRHNVGSTCVRLLSRLYRIPLAQRRRLAALGQGEIEGVPAILARPRTFMNVSGQALEYLVHRFSLVPQRLVVISDDLDLPLGKVRIRPRGSAGGHKGLQSIISALGTTEFPRIRVGIGRPPPGTDEVRYVLSPFTPEEEQVIGEAVARAAQAVAFLLREGIQAAMSQFN